MTTTTATTTATATKKKATATKTAAKNTAKKRTARASATKGPVTRKRQDQFTGAAMVAALETAWAAIRAEHAEVPAAVLIIGSGTAGRQAKWGHYAAMRWQHGTDQLPEVFVSGEGLRRTPSEVLTTLLHEAAHALADVRGIKDTSRQGRWHNAKFAQLADELGLDATKDARLGYSPCTLREASATTYKEALNTLEAALSAYRHPEITIGGTTRKNNNNALACSCQCPRRIRVAKAVLDDGEIVCTLCDAPFTPDDDPDGGEAA